MAKENKNMKSLSVRTLNVLYLIGLSPHLEENEDKIRLILSNQEILNYLKKNDSWHGRRGFGITICKEIAQYYGFDMIENPNRKCKCCGMTNMNEPKYKIVKSTTTNQ